MPASKPYEYITTPDGMLTAPPSTRRSSSTPANQDRRHLLRPARQDPGGRDPGLAEVGHRPGKQSVPLPHQPPNERQGGRRSGHVRASPIDYGLRQPDDGRGPADGAGRFWSRRSATCVSLRVHPILWPAARCKWPTPKRWIKTRGQSGSISDGHRHFGEPDDQLGRADGDGRPRSSLGTTGRTWSSQTAGKSFYTLPL